MTHVMRTHTHTNTKNTHTHKHKRILQKMYINTNNNILLTTLMKMKSTSFISGGMAPLITNPVLSRSETFPKGLLIYFRCKETPVVYNWKKKKSTVPNFSFSLRYPNISIHFMTTFYDYPNVFICFILQKHNQVSLAIAP